MTLEQGPGGCEGAGFAGAGAGEAAACLGAGRWEGQDGQERQGVLSLPGPALPDVLAGEPLPVSIGAFPARGRCGPTRLRGPLTAGPWDAAGRKHRGACPALPTDSPGAAALLCPPSLVPAHRASGRFCCCPQALRLLLDSSRGGCSHRVLCLQLEGTGWRGGGWGSHFPATVA